MNTTLRLVAATAAVTIGALAIPATASAHHPLITGTTTCTTGDTWTVTWTARADADRPLTWRITAPAGYTPAGSQADELPFTRTASYPTSQASATETVSAAWSNQVTATRSATVQRPEPCPTPPTTTTTLPPATTTEPPATTLPPPDTTTPPTEPPTTTIVAVGEPPVPTTPPVEPTNPEPTATVSVATGGALPATGPTPISPQIGAVALLLAAGAILLVAARRPIP